jgi:AmmeMemoRadiSam system protein B/AmmeMemoRadiSam system protein A
MFYPDNPKELATMVDVYLTLASQQTPEGHIFALISPHAGYGYSGQTAAFGYKLIKGKNYRTVIVIGSGHHYGFNGASIYKEGIFRTPLGGLSVDTDFVTRLLGQDEEMFFEAKAFEKEHSVEVQLPFLQRTLSSFKIVPIVMGDCSLATCKKFAQLLKEAIGERKDVLVIASSDMYHGYDWQEAEAIDQKTLDYLKNMDSEGLYYALREERAQLCGGFGVVVTLFLAKELGCDQLSVLNYTNSAIVTENKNKGTWTVGYASCVINGSGKVAVDKEACLPAGRENDMLNKVQRKRLLEIARSSIESYLKNKKKIELSEKDPLLTQDLGAFVTLREHNELRGCIGNLIASEPLYLTIRDMAIESATGDPRFPQVSLAELKNIEIEISVLSPMERINSADKIELGKHGVLIKKGFRSGVFLPQVATETGWTKEEFLSNLCSHKAGLASDCWKDESTEIYIFSAEVFS